MQSAARRYRLALFTKNRSNPAYAGARIGADRLADRLGCSISHYVPDTADDIDEQRALLGTALRQGTDAVVLAPTHATQLNDVLASLAERGIPLLCIISKPQGIEPICFVGADDRALARGIADYLFDHILSAAEVVSIEGHANALTTAPRAAGFREAAAARTGVRIVASRSGDFQVDGGKAAMLALLAGQPRIDGVLAANDAMALGAIAAMRQRQRLAPIVAVNATPDAIESIKRGELLASAAFDAMLMTCLAVEAAVRVLSGQAVPAELMLPVEIVARSNCENWDRPYQARALPDWQRYAPN